MSSKLQLSAQEIELVNNTKWILTKHNIIQKVYDLFGEINGMIKDKVTDEPNLFLANISGGKISKGENYKGLPYVILDHPAAFERDNVFVVRTMFWWGNFFSITLHLSGSYKSKYISDEPETLHFLQKNNFFICVNEEEWQHHFEEDNYVDANKISVDDLKKIMQKNFFKAAKNIALTEWKNSPIFLIETFLEVINLLKINYRGDRTDL